MKEQNILIDVHAHVLPGVDDGCRSMQESCRLLQMAAEQGITAVIATPHYSRRRTLPGLYALTERLQQEIRKTNPDMMIYAGQETWYHEELPERLKRGEAYTMAGSRYVLVEFSPGISFAQLMRGIRRLCEAGYKPVVAHMERYFCLRREENLKELIRQECWLQMNYESIQGSWLYREVRWCRRQIREGRIDLLGSDMHRPDFRPPDITDALEWLDRHVSRTEFRAMTGTNAMKMLRDYSGVQK